MISCGNFKVNSIYFVIILVYILSNFQEGFSQENSSLLNNYKSDAPVKIFYGLNESHSNNWVQMSESGLIGIVYYNSENSQLIYKTISLTNYEYEEIITTGEHLEISVLLYDQYSNPHVFVAESNDENQKITHFFKNNNDWKSEVIITFQNEGGKFIYELSADNGPDNTFHLLVLKTRSNPDSDDYYYAYLDSYLYYINNSSGAWKKELIHNYDMIYTLDEYSKALNRQDIDIDANGNAHVVFGEEVNGASWSSPSRLQYATNKSGSWIFETAFDYTSNTRDDAGWFPSLKLDKNDIPYIACTYVSRVSTGSSMSAKLHLLRRTGISFWSSELIADKDDGYYGTDGRRYTGGLNNLLFDTNNNPHILFTDIASSHAGMNYWNLGNIRHAVKINNEWKIEKVYEQNLPTGFFSANEIYSLCGLITSNAKVKIIAQELSIIGENNYTFNLLELSANNIISNEDSINTPSVGVNVLNSKNITYECYPNPFKQYTNIEINLMEKGDVSLNIYDINGSLVYNIIQNEVIYGTKIFTWNGKNNKGFNAKPGIYFCQLIINHKIVDTLKIYYLA